jgi:ribonuclease P protein component
MTFTFTKAERLSSKIAINQLFVKGSEKTESVFLYPFRVVYLAEPTKNNEPVAILVSVPKRTFKKAVDRNIIKRRIKEAYRLNKGVFYEQPEQALPANVAFMYVGKEVLPFENIEQKLKLVLQKIIESFSAINDK